MSTITEPRITQIGKELKGALVERIDRKLGDLTDIFHDKGALHQLPPDRVIYEVASYFPVQHDTEGGLFYGITYIHPGVVGNEYFMTKGHFHRVRNRGEYYFTMEGEGMLILMDEQRKTWAEKMYPGSVHYIPGHVAHRTANTGDTVLSFSAVWPSDAGHDYATISEDGFSKILVSQDGIPTLIDNR
ncbi:MAG: cupin domain-containing protein [Chitinophagaceae bacterium]|nr:cupin domain-containing protein [Chitinophagaceae bacterium]